MPASDRCRGPFARSFGLAFTLTVSLSACMAVSATSPASPESKPTITLSSLQSAEQAGFVDVSSLVPGLNVKLRYAGTDNFVGTVIEGYHANRCLLHAPVAAALARVELRLRAQGYALDIYDCYRPTVAVEHFLRWAADAADQRSKPAYYPRLDKAALVPDYIAARSGHSRGATVDLGLLDCRSGACRPLDMGTRFDFFDPAAHTESPLVSAEARAHRFRLREAMATEGFLNYPLEWWHYRFEPEPTPTVEYAFPVQ